MSRYLFITLICLLTFVSCRQQDYEIRIAVSKTYSTYESWLKNADPDVEIVNMYGLRPDSAIRLLESCSGLLLTGGEDVDPSRYGKGNELHKCEEIDHYRDTLELALIARANEAGMPVFGICRGEQILNVAMGGTLLTDIPTDAGTDVLHRSSESDNGCPHLVNIEKGSMLHTITGVTRDSVNSYHHQAIDKIAPGFRIAAVSDNGVAEAMERIDPQGKSFMMAVQWHPEKSTQKKELSAPLGRCFLEKIREYDNNLTKKD